MLYNRNKSVLRRFAIQLDATAIQVIQIGGLGHNLISWYMRILTHSQVPRHAPTDASMGT